MKSKNTTKKTSKTAKASKPRMSADAARAEGAVKVKAALGNGKKPKAAKPTQQEISNYYEQMKPGMGSKTFDDVKGDIEKMLAGQKINERRQQYLTELSGKYEVKMLLDPPRSTITTPIYSA